MPSTTPRSGPGIRPLAAAAGLVAASVALAGCAGGVLDPKGPVAANDSTLLIDATVVMLCVVVPTIGLAFWMAWRHRASNIRAPYLPEWAYSGRIEALVWSVPLLVICFIGGLIWIGSYRQDPYRPLPSRLPAEEVEVVSLDWKWLFIYPREGVATVNQLVIPAGRPVHFSLTSSSVMNVFFVPQLGSMIYTMNGMVSQLWLQADRPGVYRGQSSHFSGDGFSDMNFRVRSLSDADFAAWAASTRGAGAVLDVNAYRQLARQSQNVKPYAYGGADPGLFRAIALQTLPPAAGPSPEGPAHAGREVSTGGSD